MKTVNSGFIIVTGFLARPCHLPLTLHLILTLCAGTALDAFIAQNVALLAVVMTVYLVVALALDLGIGSRGKAEACCPPSVRAAKPQVASAQLPYLAQGHTQR